MFDEVRPIAPGQHSELTLTLARNLGRPHLCDPVAQWVRKLNPLIVEQMLRLQYTGYVKLIVESDDVDDLSWELADEIANRYRLMGWFVTWSPDIDAKRYEFVLTAT
jgi:hypothetical protein